MWAQFGKSAYAGAVASTRMSEEVAYNIVKAYVEGLKLQRPHGAVKGWDPVADYFKFAILFLPRSYSLRQRKGHRGSRFFPSTKYRNRLYESGNRRLKRLLFPPRRQRMS